MSIITDLIGVKEGERFVVGNTGRMFKIENDRIFENTGISYWKEISEYNTYLWLLENAEKIEITTNKRGLSKQQITAIKGRIAEGTPWAVKDISGEEIAFYSSTPCSEDYYVTSMNVKLYDFLKVGQAVYLPDLIGGEDE